MEADFLSFFWPTSVTSTSASTSELTCTHSQILRVLYTNYVSQVVSLDVFFFLEKSPLCSQVHFFCRSVHLRCSATTKTVLVILLDIIAKYHTCEISKQLSIYRDIEANIDISGYRSKCRHIGISKQMSIYRDIEQGNIETLVVLSAFLPPSLGIVSGCFLCGSISSFRFVFFDLKNE